MKPFTFHMSNDYDNDHYGLKPDNKDWQTNIRQVWDIFSSPPSPTKCPINREAVTRRIYIDDFATSPG